MNSRAAPHRGIDAHYGEADDAEPSKSELKRRSQALQTLGEELAALSADALERIEMPESLREAILALQRTRSHEGRRRQQQYVGKLMRNADEAALREAVSAATVGSARETLLLHEAERWRAQLVADDAATGAWIAAHPDSDAQHLRSLVRAARRDAADPAPGNGAAPRQSRHWRELFQFIKPHLTAST
jgi:ribosome-associated protein